ncbi:hypothetical protein K439DRAFT_1627789 [Ramaria rubella]|nr:hypothetical protein K439DRAFT_1627789 [Ramaria rubella]
MEGDNLELQLGYEKTELNKIGRHKERAKYDKATISTIIREAKLVHVAFVDNDGMPQCVPMIGALEDTSEGDLVLYLHGHPSSRIYKRLSESNVRVVATGTIVDGYVLALSSFGTSMNYRSAVLHGYTLPLGTNAGEDADEEKTKAFARITDRTIPGRWDYARKPTATEFKGTAVVRVIIDSASAKVRTGPPIENTKDLEDVALTNTVWTGVVPVRTVTGAPQATGLVETPPEHVRQLQ